MCCLFGIVDYQNNFTPRQLNRITAVLSRACEARGTDATGIAYNWKDDLKIYKQPLPAHKMKYHIPFGVHTIMGHTRMTTQEMKSRTITIILFMVTPPIQILHWHIMVCCIMISFSEQRKNYQTQQLKLTATLQYSL